MKKIDEVVQVFPNFNDGGPAFPTNSNILTGMTLRDYFAGQALNGFCKSADFFEVIHSVQTDCNYVERLVLYSYKFADYMIAEKNRKVL